MNKTLIATAILAAATLAACSSEPESTATVATPAETEAMAPPAVEPAPMASTNPMVGGAEMLPERDIVDNASNSQDHTTLVAAVQAADLVDTLKGPGPFTVFAPTNAAFEALPAGTVDGLLEPAAKADLTSVLTYHVVSGQVDAAALTEQIQAGGGTATLTSVQGGTLTAAAANGGVTITDAQGNVANVTTADVMQSNGVIHVVDKVLMP